MRKKHIALSLGIIAALTGFVFVFIATSDLPNTPPWLPFSNSDDFVEQEVSTAQNESRSVVRESPEDAATVSPARIFACDPPKTEVVEAEFELDGNNIVLSEKYREYRDSRHRILVEIAAALVKSNDPEHLLMAALIGFDRKSEESLAAMEKALAADPDNPLTLWNFLDTCAPHSDAKLCADGSIEKRAISADEGNGQLWGKIVGYRFDQGDISGAYDALTKANVAPLIEDYELQQVEMFERGLAAATDYPSLERIERAFEIVGETTVSYVSIFDACGAQVVAGSAEWLKACVEFGKRLESDGKSIDTMDNGIQIQELMHKLAGDAAKEKDDLLRYELFDDLVMSRSSDTEVLFSFDNKVRNDYMDVWATHGQLRAEQFLEAEVVRLSKQPGYDPCKLRGEESAQAPE